MKKILFVNYCAYIPGEKTIKRTFYLFDLMLKEGYDVTFLTSDFNHYEKKERNVEMFFSEYPEYINKIVFVHMNKYFRNISLKRFISNIKCEKEILEWYKKNGKEYDTIYISWPTYGLVNEIYSLCQNFGSKMILDINDLWPDSLKLIFKNQFVYNLFTKRLQKKTARAFSYADGLVAVSNEYLEIALKSNHKSIKSKAVYIGSVLEKFDEGVATFSEKIEKKNTEFWLIYVGTFGASYDLETSILAVDTLRKKYKLDVKLKLLGQGPEESRLKKIVESNKCDGVDFLGFLEYGLMAAYLHKSDAALNCIKKRASQSIINKAADYFSSGIPVLNCGPCREMKALIDKNHAGINYEAENVESLVNSVIYLINNPDFSRTMGKNARKLAEDSFDRFHTHHQLIEFINSI